MSCVADNYIARVSECRVVRRGSASQLRADRRLPYYSAPLKPLGWLSLGATLTKNFFKESLAARPGFSGQALPATGLLRVDPAFGTGRDWVTKPTIKKEWPYPITNINI